MDSIYKSKSAEEQLLQIYDKSVNAMGLPYKDHMIETRYGKTHVLEFGDPDAKPLVVFHGGNSINPLTLIWYKELITKYRVIAPDTIGHPGKSEQKRISPTDNSYGEWASDVFESMDIDKAFVMGTSYGAGIALRLTTVAPQKIEKLALLIPSGIVKMSVKAMLQMLIPMLIYKIAPSDKNMIKFLRPMMTEEPSRDLMDLMDIVNRKVIIEKEMPKIATIEELNQFKAPVLIFASDNDLFFPAAKVIPRIKELFINVKGAITLKNSKHFPSKDGLIGVNIELMNFFK